MSTRRQVLMLGGSGLVGSRLRELWADAFELSAPTHAQLNVLDPNSLAELLTATPASVVVNLAAWADVDGAEAEHSQRDGRVYALNAAYPAQLASLCAEHGKHLVHVSTDYVFDGTSSQRPYTEDDATHPLCWYASTKLDGERAVLSSGADVCVARIEMPFSASPHPKVDLARLCLARFRRGEPLPGVMDQQITPVFLDDVARALGLLIEARFTGVIHVAPTEWTTPYLFAQGIAQRLQLDPDLVRSDTFANFAGRRPARRPQHSWLDVSLFEQRFGRGILRSPEAQLDAWVAQVLEMSERV